MKKLILLLLTVVSIQLMAQTEGTLLGTWSDPTLIGSSQYDNTYNEIWGYAVNGQEYAIIGSTAGTHFINVTDPANPIEEHMIEGTAQGGNIVHRDYHDYQGYLYAACGEGNSTLQIIDMSQLPNAAPVVYEDNSLFTTSHNIFIDVEQGVLYGLAVGGGQGQYALRLYDLKTDPLNPTYIASYNNLAGLQVGHVHDAYVRDGQGFFNCGNSGLAIVDFSDPMNPIGLGTLTSYPDAGYNHSGWANDDCTHYYFADENWGYDMKILDLTDVTDLAVTSADLFNVPGAASTSIAHNQIIACNLLYVSYYYDGIQVWDVSDADNPERVMFYDTSNEPDDQNYKGAWGIYPYLPSGNILVSDMQEGLFVLEAIDAGCDPQANVKKCFAPDPNNTNELNKYVTSFEVFPQPATSELNVSISTDKGSEAVIEMIDLRGKVVQQFSTTNLQAGENNFSFLLKENIATGMYVLRIVGEQLNISKKIILE